MTNATKVLPENDSTSAASNRWFFAASTDAPAISWAISSTKVDQLHAIGILGRGVKVGHLDSGIETAQRDLGAALSEHCLVDEAGQRLPNADIQDITGHGTGTAGAIVGTYRSRTKIGTAPEASLVSAKVIEGGATIVRLLKGLDWLADRNVEIALCCVGLPAGNNPVLEVMLSTLRKSGMLIVCSAGNDGAFKVTPPSDQPSVLAVGAHNFSEERANFSGFLLNEQGDAYISPDISAPGVGVPTAGKTGEVEFVSGTSAAAAIVAGVAALLRSAVPEATTEELRSALCLGSTVNDSNKHVAARFGTLDALASLKWLQENHGQANSEIDGRSYVSPRNWIDPRLIYQLTNTDSTECLTAVFIVAPNESDQQRREKVSNLISEIEHIDPDARHEYISRGAALIVTARSLTLKMLTAHSDIEISSAADAGRNLRRWYRPT